MTSDPAPTRRPIAAVRISTVGLLGIVAAIAVPPGAWALASSFSLDAKTAKVPISQPGPVTKILVSDANSSVHITGDPALSGVSGHADLSWHSAGKSRPPALNQTFANGVLTLSRVCGTGDCTANIDIEVPPTVSVEVVTTNNGIDVSGVSGTVSLTTTNAGITAQRLGSGDTYLKTTNSSIKASFVGGPKNITAQTTNSEVDITTDGRTKYYDDVQTTNSSMNLSNAQDHRSDNTILVRTTNSGITVK